MKCGVTECGQTNSGYTDSGLSDSGSKDEAKGNAAYWNAAKRNGIAVTTEHTKEGDVCHIVGLFNPEDDHYNL